MNTPKCESFEAFLANEPPGSTVSVEGAFDIAASVGLSGPTSWRLEPSRFKLHCWICDGERSFDPSPSGFDFGPRAQSQSKFLWYTCSDCRKATKQYAIIITTKDLTGNIAELIKLGERPAFGPPLPSRLVTLLRESVDLLSAGRRCENQSMGIGAFVYYRRVIENQRGKLFDEIIRAAETLGGYDELIADLRAAKTAHRFTESVEAIKHGLPQSLLVKGENPLILLHSALSDGVHNLSDADCLTKATAIRRVLSAFAERLETVIASDESLAQAVEALRRPPQPGR